MTQVFETEISSAGETLWPVDTVTGLRYIRAVDIEIFRKFIEPELRNKLAESFVEDDGSDPIGGYSG